MTSDFLFFVIAKYLILFILNTWNVSFAGRVTQIAVLRNGTYFGMYMVGRIVIRVWYMAMVMAERSADGFSS